MESSVPGGNAQHQRDVNLLTGGEETTSGQKYLDLLRANYAAEMDEANRKMDQERKEIDRQIGELAAKRTKVLQDIKAKHDAIMAKAEESLSSPGHTSFNPPN